MEYVDVLDDKGNLTGEIKPYPEIHDKGYWHKAVHVWIINSSRELLIQKRAHAKQTHPDLWDISSAGHVSAGEDSVTAAIRETQEELGLKLDKGNLEYLFTLVQQVILNNGTYINNEFNDVYLVLLDLDTRTLALQQDEVAKVNSIHFAELEKMIKRENNGFVPHDEEYARLFSELHKRFS